MTLPGPLRGEQFRTNSLSLLYSSIYEYRPCNILKGRFCLTSRENSLELADLSAGTYAWVSLLRFSSAGHQAD